MSHTNQQTIETYNTAVEKYRQTSPQKVDGDLKHWIDTNLAKVDRSAKILEIGSGTGKDADYFESQGYKMELTDASRGFVDYLTKKGKAARQLNAIKDDLGSGYDMVFADAVLLHFNKDELVKVISKIHAALVNHGLFVFSLKAGTGEEVTDRKLDNDRYFRYWQAEDITKLLRSSGFDSIEITTVDDYRKDGRPDWLLISSKKVAL